MTVKNFTHSCAQSQVSVDFLCTISEFQNTSHSQRISHGKSYEYGFMKKCDSNKLCRKSRVKSSFVRFFVHHSEFKYTSHSQRISPWEVVREWFHEKMSRL
ncbi:hypothetical protein B296_00045341 [Ensete ventricosum]|uniref:Uncharacterized protein n=1 Tax=Ensete ventricosum TaxID=4639 RepID=A0A426XWW0_ENSVE|nr:hypothetical protein B296_00045341 [Ensete ventricosum]